MTTSSEMGQRVKRALAGDRTVTVTRAVPLNDIKIRKSGDGRTVDAYAAVFMTPTEIVDSDGHYMEQNDPGAFSASLAQRRDKIFCIYNHGRTLQGTPSDIYSVPVGVPCPDAHGRETPYPDGRGLFTSTRYNEDPEADRILEAIRSGSLKGMSYTGVFLNSRAADGSNAPWYPERDGHLILVTRTEIALIEYGATPIPAYDTAAVVGVRSRDSVTLLTKAGVSAKAAKAKVSRSAVMIHHTPIVYTSNWDENNTLNAMSFPASQADMGAMFAYYDERAAGVDAGDSATDTNGSFPRYAGYLAHHDLGANGKPGPANTTGVAQCLARLDTLPDNFYGASKEGVRSHLLAHQADMDPGKTGLNPSSAQGTGQPQQMQPSSSAGRKAKPKKAMLSPGGSIAAAGSKSGKVKKGKKAPASTMPPAPNIVGSSGRAPDEDRERTDASALTHHEFTGQHSHPHLANAALNAGNNAAHEHMHAHNNDHMHEHDHTGMNPTPVSVMTTPVYSGMASSGRKPEGTASDYAEWEESVARAKASNKPYGNVTYADPKNGKYPIDADHVVAAWSYINKPKNAKKYPLNGVTLASVKAKIKAAMAKYGHKVSAGGSSGNNGSTSSSGRQPAAVMSTGPRNGHSAEPHQHPAATSREQDTMGKRDRADGDAVRMTIGERIERQSAVRARLAEIDTEYLGAELPAEARTEWRSLQEELIVHSKAIKDAQERAQYLAMIAESPDHTESTGNGAGYDGGYAPFGSMDTGGFDRSAGYNTISAMRGTTGPAFRQDLGDAIYDLTSIRNRARSMEEVPMLYREYAMRAVERARYPTPDKSREDCQSTIERLLMNVDDEHGTLSRRLLVTGSPIYDRAFGKALAGMSTNGLTSEEARSLQLGADPQGGFAVPFQLDPTVILTSNGAINPLRQISRIEQIVGKEWDGVTSAGVVVTRVSEGTEAATGDALFVQPKVRTTRVQGFVPFNIELDVSWGALRSQMTSLLMDAKDVEEATSFAIGSGTAPAALGIVTNTHDTANTVATVGTATLAIGDLYALENAMPPRFRQQSAYLASKTTFNRFRQLFQAQASAAFDSWVRPSAGTPATFNGYPAYEQSAMSAAITSGAWVLLQGDFSKFLIVDRVGMGIELIPHLFGTARSFPLGQRGILAIWFNNSQPLVNSAFRLLVTT